MAQLAVGVPVNVYYEAPSGGFGQVMGTVATINPDYLEVTTASGTNVSIGWARITSASS